MGDFGHALRARALSEKARTWGEVRAHSRLDTVSARSARDETQICDSLRMPATVTIPSHVPNTMAPPPSIVYVIVSLFGWSRRPRPGSADERTHHAD